jgi:murein DD-endopeptidase MepM/ murein hydrolase activator NlpD
MHNGVDYAAPRGTPVGAIAGGTVLFVGKKGPNGNLVALKHTNGWQSYYAHLSKFAQGMKPGTTVKQGTVLGYVGSTGRSTGPHLHLGIKDERGFIDPLKVHSTRGSSLKAKSLAQFKGQLRDLDAKLDKTTILAPSDLPDDPEPEGNDKGVGEGIEN